MTYEVDRRDLSLYWRYIQRIKRFKGASLV